MLPTSVSPGDRERNALRCSESRYRRLFEAARDGILLLNAVTAQIEDVNPYLIELLGYSHAEFLGRKLWEVGAFADVAQSKAMFAELRTAGYVRYEDLPLRAKSGAHVAVEFVSNVYDCDGVQVIQCNIRDITERKRVAAALEQHRHHLEALVEVRTQQIGQLYVALQRRAEEADAASRAKSALLANMGHEVRTPMNGILGMAHLVRRGGVSPTQASQLDQLDHSGRHLVGVVDDLRVLAKIEVGAVTPNDADFLLGELLQSVIDVVRGSIESRGLALRVEATGLPPTVRGDAPRLRQALLNYLSNAVKFTAHGGIVLAGEVVEETADGYLLRFAVTDTGIGVTKEACTQLFEQFQQLDASSTRSYGGAGLGLVLTKRIAALMGGEVGVDSVRGHGSRFWLTVRMGKGGAASAIASPAVAETAEAMLRRVHGGKRVLVVEDEPICQQVTHALLQEVGLVPGLAINGREAVDLVTLTDYALILMDMQMPEMDGLAATRAIRALPSRNTTPIIALTANVLDEDRQACFAAGMDDFIAKPVVPEQLYATVLKWLGDGRGATRQCITRTRLVADGHQS